MNNPKRFVLLSLALTFVVLGFAYKHHVAKGGAKTVAACVSIPSPSNQQKTTQQLLNQAAPSSENCRDSINSSCSWPCYWSPPMNCWWHYDPCPTPACGGPLPKQERHWRCWVYCTGEAWCTGSYWTQISKECVICG